MNCFNKNTYKCVNCGSSSFKSDYTGLTCLYCSSYYLKDTLKEKKSNNNSVFSSSTALTVSQLRSAFASSESLDKKYYCRGVRL